MWMFNRLQIPWGMWFVSPEKQKKKKCLSHKCVFFFRSVGIRLINVRHIKLCWILKYSICGQTCTLHTDMHIWMPNKEIIEYMCHSYLILTKCSSTLWRTRAQTARVQSTIGRKRSAPSTTSASSMRVQRFLSVSFICYIVFNLLLLPRQSCLSLLCLF